MTSKSAKQTFQASERDSVYEPQGDFSKITSHTFYRHRIALPDVAVILYDTVNNFFN